MRISFWICLIVNIAALLAHVLCMMGLSGLKRSLRQSTFSQCVQESYNIGSFSIIFVCLICPWSKAQILVTNVFQSISFSSLFHFTSPIVREEYSLIHRPNSLFIMECLTGVFAVQHLILLVVLYQFKPTNFDFFEYDHDETENTSQTVSEEAPPPYEEIATTMPIKGDATVPP